MESEWYREMSALEEEARELARELLRVCHERDGLMPAVDQARHWLDLEASQTYSEGDRPPSAPAKAKISSTLRRLVMERDAYRCVTCGGHKDLSIDHIVPESKGGPTTEINLQTMCRPCNSSKGTSMPEHEATPSFF